MSDRTHETSVDLFSPVHLGPYELPNRLVMAPLTRNRAGEGNIARAMNAEYYAQRASAGLIITEASQISPQGVGYPLTPGIHSDAQIAGWKLVTDAVHARGGRIFLQLWHVGRISHPSLQAEGTLPVAPSPIKPEGDAITNQGLQPFVTPRELRTEEIPGIIEQFRLGARNALSAGFDGVEVHATNGYLLDQFLRDGTNRRTDTYGGSLKNRVRFLLEVIEAVVDIWGRNRVGVRLSPLNAFNSMYDSDPETLFSYVVKRLNLYRLSYLHMVEARDSAAGPLFDTRSLRGLYEGLYMANGGYDKERATQALASGDADLISFGTLFLVNPDLPERFARNTPLNTPDPTTFYGGDDGGYTDYPFLDTNAAEARNGTLGRTSASTPRISL